MARVEDGLALHLARAKGSSAKLGRSVSRIGGAIPRGCASAREGRVFPYFVRRNVFETKPGSRPKGIGSHGLILPPPAARERASTPAAARVPAIGKSSVSGGPFSFPPATPSDATGATPTLTRTATSTSRLGGERAVVRGRDVRPA